MNTSIYTPVIAPGNEPHKKSSEEIIITDILSYIDDFKQRVVFKPEYKRLVIVVGNSGTGKSTLISYLAGDDLVAERKENVIRIYNSTQTDLVIGQELDSETFFPAFKNASGIVYCDMPGFGDTRGIKLEIAKAIFMKEVADNVAEVKILATIAYSDILDARVAGLRSLVKHLSSFIRNLNKLDNGVDLVVTKVDNNLSPEDDFLTDDEIIQDIYVTLNKFIKENPDEYFFLKSIINQQRLKIFRKPSKIGKLKDISLRGLGKVFENEQKHIKDTIANTSYVSKANIDFGYSMTSDAQLDSISIAKSLIDKMAKDLELIFEGIKKYYSSQAEISTDIYKFKTLLDTHDWSKERFDLSDPILFLDSVKQKINGFGISIPQDKNKFKNFSTKDRFLKFLQSINERIEKYNYYISLDLLITFLEAQKGFYRDILGLIQISLLDETVINNLSKLKEKSNRNSEELSKIIKDYNNLADPQKLEVDKILNCILEEPSINPKSIEYEGLTLVIGNIINLSKVKDLIKGKNTDLCICSSKAIILDSTLNLPGKNVSIISPEWYVFGTSKITLDGLEGEKHEKGADDGVTDGQNGTYGLPGNPGHSAGNFLGIGVKFHNSSALTISANGGKGGLGQKGGNGRKGKDGDVALNPEHDQNNRSLVRREQSTTLSTIFYRTIYKTLGTKGENGGNSGKGGIGGFGGKKGHIELLFSNSNSVININNEGTKGDDGSKGEIGLGGNYGKDKFQTLHESEIADYGSGASFWQSLEEKEHTPAKASDGVHLSGLNDHQRKPSQAIQMNWYKPLIEYKRCFAKNLRDKCLKHNTEEFLAKLNEIQGMLGN